MTEHTQITRPGAVLAVDIGGTFTDAVITTPTGLFSTKVLTTPDDPAVGFIASVRRVLAQAGVDPTSVSRVIHGTTLATNVILERRGAPVALVTTEGYRSLLALGRDGRVEEERYDLWVTQPAPIVPLSHTFEVRERILANGDVLVPFDEAGARQIAAHVASLGVAGVAICFLNSYVTSHHEDKMADLCREVLPAGTTVITSSSVLAEMREFERLTTTVMSAYVGPVMTDYLDALTEALAREGIEAPILVMESSGGVMPSRLAALRPVHTIESGPAAGVIAAARVGQDCGIPDVIAFDMGGTTAKAALVRHGAPAITHDFGVGGKGSFGGRRAGSGIPIKIPAIDLAEVGSGGGSIAWIDPAGALRVGPRSAGASPGPVCYGQGGAAPTVTDANLVLGYLSGADFAGGAMTLDGEAAHRAIAREIADPLGVSVYEAANAICEIANANMAAAIHVVTVQRGIDPRRFGLVATGGAAAMHACRIAEQFDIEHVMIAPHDGVGSAVGLAMTDLLAERSRSHLVALADAVPAEIEALFVTLTETAAHDLGADGTAAATDAVEVEVEVERSIAVRFVGQAHELEIAIGDDLITAERLARLEHDFGDAYAQAFGLTVRAPLQLVSFRSQVRRRVPKHDQFGDDTAAQAAEPSPANHRVSPKVTVREAWVANRSIMAPTNIWNRRDLLAGDVIAGPAIIDGDDSTVVVPPNWNLEVHPSGALSLRTAPGDLPTLASGGTHTGSDREQLVGEILRSALVAAAEEASIVVVRAAHSAFVVEGSDASAAILDHRCRLVAQSMATTLLHSASLRCSLPAVLDVFPLEAMTDGDIYAMNDVYRGGIHANDILVFKPVFANGRPRWFTATLIHILDLGGSAAAGVSSLATDVFQEGLQLPPVRIGTAAGLDAQLLSIIAANSRLPEATMGDLRALIAGVNVAARRVQLLIDDYGTEGLASGIESHLDRSERLMRLGLAEFPDGTYDADYLLDDDGIHPDRTYQVVVSVTIDNDRATIDFTGTDAQVAASINAGFSQTMSGALFALRCFLDPTIPMNEGCFTPVEFVIPPGTLLNCTPPFPGGGRFLAVFAAVEAIFQALSQATAERAIAASGILQPFALDGRTPEGNTWIHTAYELGGMGARFGNDGLDAVGVHHGGGRNAIPQSEPLESRFPFVVERVELIPDSGGLGQWRGGLGTRTTFLLLNDARLTMRCDRLDHPPVGSRGGQAGRAGGYFRVTADGEWIRLPDKSSGVAFAAGDRFVLETSGGGGLGPAHLRDKSAIDLDHETGRVTAAPG